MPNHKNMRGNLLRNGKLVACEFGVKARGWGWRLVDVVVDQERKCPPYFTTIILDKWSVWNSHKATIAAQQLTETLHYNHCSHLCPAKSTMPSEWNPITKTSVDTQHSDSLIYHLLLYLRIYTIIATSPTTTATGAHLNCQMTPACTLV